MTPAAMSAQAAVLSLALAVTGVVWSTPFALAGCVAVLLAAVALYGGYRRDLSAREAAPSPKRAAGDRLVRRQWLLGSLVPFAVVLAGYAWGLRPTPPEVVSVILVAATLGAATIYLSSLVDWYWVMPRISGIVAIEQSDSAWRQLTRVWLAHRAVTKLVVSLLPIAVLIYVATITTDETTKTALYVVAGLAASALAPLNDGLRLVLNPPVYVGDVVKLPEGPASIIDMSMEGARYVLVGRARSVIPFSHADGLISLRDLSRYPRIAGAADETRRQSVERFWAERQDAQPHWPRESQPQATAEVAAEQSQRLRPRMELQATEISLLILTVATVVALALTALRFVVDGAGSAVATITVGSAVIGITGLVHSAVSLRRRVTLDRARTPSVPLDAELATLSRTIHAQRLLLRVELGDGGRDGGRG